VTFKSSCLVGFTVVLHSTMHGFETGGSSMQLKKCCDITVEVPLQCKTCSFNADFRA
jgi:hypothetical protein